MSNDGTFTLHVLLYHFIFFVHNFSFTHVMLNFPDGMNKAVILKGEKTRKDTRKGAKRHLKRHNTMRIDTNKSRSNVLLVSFRILVY